MFQLNCWSVEVGELEFKKLLLVVGDSLLLPQKDGEGNGWNVACVGDELLINY